MLRELFLLDPNVVFLNHGSFGACPRPVFEIYQSWQRQLENQPVRFLGNDLNDLLFSARQELGKYINVPAKDVVFIPNVTHGVNIIARSLNLMPGDEILSTDHEYGACNYIWDFVCKKTGAKYKQSKITPPFKVAEEITEQFWRDVSPRTKVIFISHITSPTSFTFPIDQICQKAKRDGILIIIDGAHAPGQLSLDLSSLQADFYTGNCHKWMLSPKGSGFLYAKPDVQEMIEPLIVSWGYQSIFMKPMESVFVDCLQWSGTRDPAAYLSVPAAIEFMQQHHWMNIRLVCHDLLRSAIERICEMFSTDPIYPTDSNFYHQMATIPIPMVRDINELKSRLYSDYKIEIPCIEWKSRHFIRLSIQGYNTGAEVDLLVKALSQLIPEIV